MSLSPQEERNAKAATADRPTRARQGVMSGRVPLILAVSLVAAILGMLIGFGVV
jgi:hypothetical protein